MKRKLVVLCPDEGFFELHSRATEGEKNDAGTDSGVTYSSADEDTDPAVNATRITGGPLGNGTTVDPPAAMFTFVKTN